MGSNPVRAKEPIRFGDNCEVDVSTYELRRAGRLVKLERIPMEMLLLLLQEHPRLVTREEIAERVWGKGVCLDTDNSINGAIRKIRHALRDDSEQPRFIQTVTGRGYRFIAPVLTPSEDGAEPQPDRIEQPKPAASPHPETSIAGPHAGGPSPKSPLLLKLTAVFVLAALLLAGYLMWRPGPQPFRDFTITQVTTGGKAEDAAISPDGKYILHVQNDNGMRSIRLRNIATASDAEVLAPAPTRFKSLMFSPDGNYVYFRQLANGIGTEWDLFRMPVLGGKPERVATDIDSDVTFSPDQKQISYVRANDPQRGEFRIIVANPDGTGEIVLTNQKIRGFGDDAYPPFTAWSADGKRIVYNYGKMPDKPGATRVLDLKSDRFDDFVSLPDLLTYEVRWLADDRWLMMVYSPEAGADPGPLQIGVVSVRDRKLHPVTRDTNSYNTLTVSSDGHIAATVQSKTDSRLQLLPSEGGEGKPSVPFFQNESLDGVDLFDWTPDGELLASDGSALWRIDKDGRRGAQLISDPSGVILGVATCANGYLLVNWDYHAGTQGSTIWRLNSDGSNPVQLTHGKHDMAPACSPDSRWAYYVDSLLSLKRVAVAGGSPEMVSESRIPKLDRLLGTVSFSRDGRQIVFLTDVMNGAGTHSEPKLALIDLGATQLPARLLDPNPGIVAGSLHGGGVRFTPDGKALAYVVREHGIGNIWLQPLDGSPGHAITSYDADSIALFRWSPDGRTLAVTRKHTTSDVVILRENEKQ